MRSLLIIARNDLRLFLVNRGNLIGLLLVPIVMTLVIGVFAGGGGGDLEPIPVDVIDLDESELSIQWVDTLREVNDDLVLCPMDNDAEDVCGLGGKTKLNTAESLSRVEEEIVDAMIEIPRGFGDLIQADERAEIIYRAREDFITSDLIQQAALAATQQINGAVVASRVGMNVIEMIGLLPAEEGEQAAFARTLYEEATFFWSANEVGVIYEQTLPEPSGITQDGLGQSVPGMGSMFVMFTVFGGIVTLIVERNQWTLQRLAVMPVSRAQLLGGKILARFSLGIIQYLVVFAVGVVAAINFGQDPLAIILIMISYTLAITALSFALGVWIKNEAQANGLSLLLSLTLAPLGGAWWPLEIVPDFMRIIGHLSPVAWAMDGFNSLIFESGDLSTVLIPILVLLGIALVCFVIAIRWFKYEQT